MTRSHGLSNPLTVVTGPPGTGKSQVVISLLANAAWRGQTALLASKNNRAVDVVVDRTNGLSARPLLIRLGRDEHQQQLGIYIASLLAAATTPEDEAGFRDAWNRLAGGAAEMRKLDVELDAVMTLRNTVGRLARDTESCRAQFREASFGATRHLDENVVRGRSGQVVRALDAADRGSQGPIVRLLWPVIAPRRCRALACAAEALGEVIVPPAARPTMRTRGKDLPPWRDFATSLLGKAEMAPAAHGYFRALRSLQVARPAEVIVRLRSDLADQLVDISQEVWRAWLRLQPARITPQQRRDLAAFGAVLRLLLAARGGHGQGRLWAQFHSLLPKVTSALPCWAVPSLSARGRVPFVPGFFDLLVVDEASQCDIASVIAAVVPRQPSCCDRRSHAASAYQYPHDGPGPTATR
ncbi:MAG: AAA domain-containing protein [Armatimonadota bacterium]